MAADYPTGNCPNSTQTPPAVVDDDGFCTEHGWDCDDFTGFLDEKADVETGDDSPIAYTTSSVDEADTEDGF